MFKIKVIHLTKPSKSSYYTNQKFYSLFIRSGKSLQFKSLSTAERAMNQIAAELNRQFVALNIIAGDAYRLYRLHYINLCPGDQMLCKMWNNLNDNFDRQVTYDNGELAYAYKKLHLTCEYLETILNRIIKKASTHKASAAGYEAKNILDRVKATQQALKDLGA